MGDANCQVILAGNKASCAPRISLNRKPYTWPASPLFSRMNKVWGAGGRRETVLGKIEYWAEKPGLLQNSQLPLFTGLPDNLHRTSSRTSKARDYVGSWMEPVGYGCQKVKAEILKSSGRLDTGPRRALQQQSSLFVEKLWVGPSSGLEVLWGGS